MNLTTIPSQPKQTLMVTWKTKINQDVGLVVFETRGYSGVANRCD